MAAKVDELQKQIGELEGKLQTIEQSEQTSQKELAELETKRRGLVTAARLDKNQKAKTALDVLDSDIYKARRAVEDDATVKASLLQELETAKDNLAVAQWEGKREQVRALVVSRMKGDGERELAELVRKVEQKLIELRASDQEIAATLSRFEPTRLNTEAHRFRQQTEGRAEVISVILEKFGVPSMLSIQYRERLYKVDLADGAKKFSTVLEAIDQLEA